MSEAFSASVQFVLMHVNVCREKGFSSIQRLWRSGTNWRFRFVSSDALKGCWGPMDGQLACKQQRPYSDQRFEWRDLMRSGLSSVKKHIEKERTGGWWKCIIHERKEGEPCFCRCCLSLTPCINISYWSDCLHAPDVCVSQWFFSLGRITDGFSRWTDDFITDVSFSASFCWS